MTEPEALAFGKRLGLACGPRPGMLLQPLDRRHLSFRIERVDVFGYPCRDVGIATQVADMDLYWIDMRDGATMGAALAAARERWGDPLLFVRPRDDGSAWEATSPDNRMEIVVVAVGKTEAAAIVSALEALAPSVVGVSTVVLHEEV